MLNEAGLYPGQVALSTAVGAQFEKSFKALKDSGLES